MSEATELVPIPPAVPHVIAPPAPRFSFGEIAEMAQSVAASGLFPGIRNQQQALTLMMLCESEGLHPMQALKRYHIIEGRPSMRADAMQAEFQNHGGRITWGQSDAEVCEATFFHPTQAPEGVPIRVTFAELREAGITSGREGIKKNWKQFPRQMLRARVVSEGVRMVLPGVVVGIYTPEEVLDFEPMPSPSPSPPPKESRASRNATSSRHNGGQHREPRRAEPRSTTPPWSEFVGRFLAHWDKLDPGDARESESRRARLLNRLATDALDAGQIPPSAITRPNSKGEIVRDKAAAARAIEDLYASGEAGRQQVRRWAKAYLDEKTAPKPSPILEPYAPPPGSGEAWEPDGVDLLDRWAVEQEKRTGLDVAWIAGGIAQSMGLPEEPRDWSAQQIHDLVARAEQTAQTMAKERAGEPEQAS